MKDLKKLKKQIIQEEPVSNTGCDYCFKKMDFSFIFLGSTHGFIDDFIKQKEVISSVKPEFVLSEELENIELNSEDSFKEFLKKKKFSDMTSFEEVERLVKLCSDKRIDLIGIDFHNFGLDKKLQKKIKYHEELTEEEEKKLDQIINQREKHHLSKILEYKEKTNKPLVIIIGCWHLRKGSLIRRRLNNYKIIAPIDNEGEVLFFADKNKEINYGVILSHDHEIEN